MPIVAISNSHSLTLTTMIAVCGSVCGCCLVVDGWCDGKGQRLGSDQVWEMLSFFLEGHTTHGGAGPASFGLWLFR
jgi:hypothetical protein